METIYPGCDTQFWHQTLPKNKDFTFLHINSSNIRSGLDLTLLAFTEAFKGNKNVKLIVKDTNVSPTLSARISTFISQGANIEYITERMHDYQIRDLYSKSHVCLNLQRMASFGLALLESSACNCLSVTGDAPPFNEVVSKDNAVLVPVSNQIPIWHKNEELIKDWGLIDCYPNFTYNESPLFYDYDLRQYTDKLIDIYENWDKYRIIDTRSPITDNWTWEKACKTLINKLA